MAIDSFPILYFNMAGEMIYIIDQRLQAQKIGLNKSRRVLNDIILSVFNPKLIDEVFKPHNAITFLVLKTIFEKLVHSSIMRLNEQSMNKLFDLMIMVIKYQLFTCPKPSDLITIADNHFLSIIEMIQSKQSTVEDDAKSNGTIKSANNSNLLMDNTVEIIHVVRNQFLFHYQSYDMLQFQQIRYNLLNFLKDIHTRVSIFLRENLQTNDGQFIIPYESVRVECECQIPGVIRYFRGGSYKDIIRTEHFDCGGQYLIDESRTTLGLNIYKKDYESKEKKNQNDQKLQQGVTNQKEIDLLARLICKQQNKNDEHNHQQDGVLELKFDFLRNNSSDESYNKNDIKNDNNKSVQVINSIDTNTELIQIIRDLDEFSLTRKNSNKIEQFSKNNEENSLKENDGQGSGDDEIDLLELMDS